MTPMINQSLFENQFDAFKRFVELKSSVHLKSFSSNPYLVVEEGYKTDIYKEALENLAYGQWKKEDIGSGKIISSVIKAIELPENNLVAWQSRFGDKARPHQPLYKAIETGIKKEIEMVLFGLYHDADPEETFNKLIEIFGKKYPLISYMYFLVDCEQYLPIAPTFFDQSFIHLGAEFKTSRLCSWVNYRTYLELIDEIKYLLSDKLLNNVSLLDAHSFTWILSAQMEEEKDLLNNIVNTAKQEDNNATEYKLTNESFPEGKMKEHLHKRRERNSSLVRIVKMETLDRTGKLECQCCGFDFNSVYGDIGTGFIEAHHIRPVSELHRDGEKTKKEDIALVCANCHRMLHRRRPWLSMNELKNLKPLMKT